MGFHLVPGAEGAAARVGQLLAHPLASGVRGGAIRSLSGVFLVFLARFRATRRRGQPAAPCTPSSSAPQALSPGSGHTLSEPSPQAPSVRRRHPPPVPT